MSAPSPTLGFGKHSGARTKPPTKPLRPPSVNRASVSTKGAPGDEEDSGLSLLLDFHTQLRDANTIEQVRLAIANEVGKLTGARQVFVFSRTEKPKIEAVSGLPNVNRTVPFIDEIERIVGELGISERLDSLHEFSTVSASKVPTSSIANYPFRYLMWVPFKTVEGFALGGMLLAREMAWQEHNRIIANQISASISYSLAFQILAAKFSMPHKKPLWKSRKAFLAAFALACALMAFPVSMKSLAPFEVVAQQPLIITSPLEGVIEDVLVEPGQPVNEGQPVLRFSDTLLKNRLEIARNEVEVSRAKLKKANQMAFEGEQGRQELGLAIAELSLKEAQLKLAKDQSEETVMRSDRSGVAVFAERQSLLGKPVSIGEQLMSIADPEKVMVRINLHVSDSILLEEGAKVKLFLDSDPLVPRDAVVEYANYRAAPIADGSLAYAITARLADDGGAIPRLGIQGSAQLYGKTVPLFMYLFRRPLTSVRQWLGW